jgi:hypothetical protein
VWLITQKLINPRKKLIKLMYSGVAPEVAPSLSPLHSATLGSGLNYIEASGLTSGLGSGLSCKAILAASLEPILTEISGFRCVKGFTT